VGVGVDGERGCRRCKSSVACLHLSRPLANWLTTAALGLTGWGLVAGRWSLVAGGGRSLLLGGRQIAVRPCLIYTHTSEHHPIFGYLLGSPLGVAQSLPSLASFLGLGCG